MRKSRKLGCGGCLGVIALIAVVWLSGAFLPSRNAPMSTPTPLPTPIPAATAIPTATRGWYEGGNLHQAELWQWEKATPSNKLATAADWIVVIGKDSLADEAALRAWAEQTVICLDTVMDAAIERAGNRASIADFAVVCITSLTPN